MRGRQTQRINIPRQPEYEGSEAHFLMKSDGTHAFSWNGDIYTLSHRSHMFRKQAYGSGTYDHKVIHPVGWFMT